MGGSTVLSVRVPEDVLRELKRMGVPVQKVVREALEKEYRKLLLKRVEERTKHFVKNLDDERIIEAVQEGRA